MEQRVEGGREAARIPRMVGADGADSWALGWSWNVAGHCLPSDWAAGVQLQPKRMFRKGDFEKTELHLEPPSF